MKLQEIIVNVGKKALYGLTSMVLGIGALAALPADKSASVVTLVLGVYSALVVGHVYTDAKVISKTTVKEEGA